MTSSKLVVGLLSVSLLASVSMAATPKNAKAAKAKVTAAAKKPATTLPAVKTVEATPAPTIEAAPVALAPSSATSTASLSTATSAVAPKKWGLLVDSWTESKVDAANLATADDSVEQKVNHALLIRPSYKLNDTTSAALGLEFSHDLMERNQKAGREAAFSDPYAMIASSKLAMLGAVKTKGYLRAYLPVSIASQDPVSGRHTVLRAQTNFVYPVSKAINLSYNLEPRFYFQKNRAAIGVNAAGARTVTPSENIRLTHWLSADASMGKFGLYQNAGLRSRWYNEYQARIDGPNVIPNQRDYLYLETGLSYAVLEQFTVAGGIYTLNDTGGRDLQVSPTQGIYRDDESSYFLELTLAL
jgi:hypothetical protein